MDQIARYSMSTIPTVGIPKVLHEPGAIRDGRVERHSQDGNIKSLGVVFKASYIRKVRKREGTGEGLIYLLPILFSPGWSMRVERNLVRLGEEG